MATAKVLIDRTHTEKLLRGESVSIRVPPGSTTLQIQVNAPPRPTNQVADIMDVFFNGRSSR